MSKAADDLLAWARSSWPAEWDASPAIRTVLSALQADLGARRPSCVPSVRGDDVRWIGIAATQADLKLYLTDLRAWIPPKLCNGGEMGPATAEGIVRIHGSRS